MTLSQRAAALLWDPEFADVGGGCAEHHDPTCLCDVDVSKTADIEWNRAPAELSDVTTVEELVDASAQMLLRLEIQNYVAEHFATIEVEDSGWTGITYLTDDQIQMVIDDALYGNERTKRPELAKLLDVPETLISSIQNAVGASATKGAIYPRAYYAALMRHYNQGCTPKEIGEGLRSEGFRSSPDGIRKFLRDRGLTWTRSRTAA